jgi:hypothetical protein
MTGLDGSATDSAAVAAGALAGRIPPSELRARCRRYLHAAQVFGFSRAVRDF